ncbi:hypothetical protein GA759_09930, partial [Bifidobacterium adolescentis]
DTGVRRNSPNRDSSSKNLSNTPLPVHADFHGTGKSLDHKRVRCKSVFTSWSNVFPPRVHAVSPA